MDLNDIGIGGVTDSISNTFKKMQFGTKSQLAFLEDLLTLVSDGIPPNRAIDMIAQVSSGMNREVARAISRRISEGQPLAAGMQEWFNPNIIEIIRVGEEGGALAETLRSAVKTLGQRSSVMGAFIGAMIYPLIVLVMACGIIVYLNNTVFVQFADIKPISEWPAAGRQLIYAASLIKHWWWTIIVAVIVVVLVLRRLMSNYIGDLRPALDTIPPFNIYRRYAAARLMETMGLLVANGVVFKSAIKVMQYQANPYVASHLVSMEHLLSMGKGNIADVLNTGLIDTKDILRLRVMAEVKGFEHGLVKMGAHGSEELNKTLKLVSKIIAGILLVLGTGLIVLIVRGIFSTGMELGAQ